uniref:dihydrofolate reductase n=1 Tax=Saccoglossus kowalevskii TaxID=10224 RepID=A0ABM0M7H8_SACKO|nr:PREDICTED: dihydrofolate reductase-like [Saccoglossus kowalevskii]
MKKISLVAAACNNMGIGKNGDLPWRLRKEMSFFTKVTSETKEDGKQNAVVMGRKTWFSIPEKYRPLAGRYNVILSKNLKECPSGADMLSESLDDAIKQLSEPPLESLESAACYRIYLTRVMADFDCDTFFPEFDTNLFNLVSDPDVPSEIQEEKGIQFKYEVYEKK